MTVLHPISHSEITFSRSSTQSFEEKYAPTGTPESVRERFAQGAGLETSRRLSQHSVSSIHEPQKSILFGKITSFAWKAFASILSSPPCSFAVKYALKGVRWGIFKGGTSLEASTNRYDSAVTAFTGSRHLVTAMNKTAPILAKIVRDKLLGLKLPQGAVMFLESEASTLQSIIRAILPKIYINLANSKERQIAKKGDSSTSFTLVDATACLVDIFKTHLPKIHEKYRSRSNDEIQDPVKHKKKLLQIFIPLSAELLANVLPEGEKELPLKYLPFISKYFWSQFRNQVLPEILLELYKQFAMPSDTDDRQKLLQSKGGDALLSIAEGAVNKAGELIPALLAMPLSQNSGKDFRLQLIKKGVDSFARLTQSSKKLQDYFSNWLARQCVELGKSDNPNIQLLWKFLGSYLEPVMLHTFRRMAEIPAADIKPGFASPDALSGIMIKLCAVLSDFFNVNTASIEVRITELKLLGHDFETDPDLLRLFNPLADKMLTIMGLAVKDSLPIPDAFKDIAISGLNELAPLFLLKQYLAIKNSALTDEAYRKRFRAQLFDPNNLSDPSITTGVVAFLYKNNSVTHGNMSDAFYQELWNKSGTEALVNTLEGMCSAFSGKVIDALMKRFGLSKQKVLSLESNPFMKGMADFLTSLVDINLLKSLVQVIETTPVDDAQRKGHPKKLLVLQLLRRYGDIFVNDMKNMEAKLKEINTEFVNDPQRRIKEVHKAFSGLANDLHASLGKNPLTAIPIDVFIDTDTLKGMLWDVFRNDILPDVLYDNYSEIMAWHHQQQDSLEKLEECYHTTHLEWACRVLAQYVSDFVRHYLSNSSPEAAKLLSGALQDYFRDNKDAQGHSIAAILRNRTDVVEDVLSQNIQAIGKSEDSQILQLWPFLTTYMEAVLVKCFSQISQMIRDIEADHPDFMVDIAINILKETSDYFTILNEQAKKHTEEHVYNINPALLLASFGAKLHNGVPLDPSAPEQEKDRTRLEGWLIPLSNKLMRLIGLTVDDLPLPSSIRGSLGEIIVKTLLPRILLAIDKLMLEPRLRDLLMLESVQMLYSALNDINPSAKEEMPDGDGPKQDPKRKNVNELCGAIVLEIVKLIPDTMVQYVFMKEKVKNMSAEAIGNAIMAYLSKWTLLQIIDTIVFKALPSLHQAKWEGKVGREVLVPRKVVPQPNGKPAWRTLKKFKFVFPETQEQIGEAREKRLAEAKLIRQKLRDGFSHTISSQLFAKSWSFIKSLWSYYQAQLDEYIAQHFSENGTQVKAALDDIFHKVFFDLIGPVVMSFSQLFIKVFQYLAEKLQIDAKSDEIIENLHSETVEHLLYKSIDIIIDKLDKLRKNLRESSPIASA